LIDGSGLQAPTPPSYTHLLLIFAPPDNGRVMEPFILLIIGYLSYLVAEIFHFSGIVA
jgi:hypothetical protein